jgi:hypothetical protein
MSLISLVRRLDMIDSIDVVIYSAYFLVPGYIISEVIRHFMPDHDVNDFEKTIRCLGYSILELALWYWLFSIITNKYENNTYKYWLFLILTVLVTSFVTGIAVGIIRQSQLLRRGLRFFDIHMDHPVPTGWDYKFSETKTAKWLCICLDNDTFIRGKFGVKSLASSEHNNHDIYLEEVYRKEEDGTWKKEDRTDGIWISSGSIKWINFYKEKGEENNG